MPNKIDAAHILLMHDGSPRSSATRDRDEAEKRIAELLEEFKAGADFAELARQHSDCPSAEKGGSLGSFARGMMVKAFEDAAFALEVDETSPVVETDFGFHIIRRTG